VFVRTLCCALLMTIIAVASSSAQGVSGENRPALPTFYGDTGLWFVPTARWLDWGVNLFSNWLGFQYKGPAGLPENFFQTLPDGLLLRRMVSTYISPLGIAYTGLLAWPIAVVTSNRTRDVHDALKRRCLYHWVEHPSYQREVEIVRLRAPDVPERLAKQVAAAAATIRGSGVYKPPGVAETIDWATAVAALGHDSLDAEVVGATLGTVLKYREDQERVRAGGLDELVAGAKARAGG